MTTLEHRIMTEKRMQYTDYIKQLSVVYFLMKISRKMLIFTVVFDT